MGQVYWRGPDGQPDKKEPDKNAPTALLALIGEHSTINDEGKASWTHPYFTMFSEGIRAAACVTRPDGRELNERDAWTIVRSAISDVIRKHGGSKAIPHTEVLKAANKKAALFFQKQLNPYTLVSSLSIDRFPAKKIKLDGCTIAPLKARTSRYPLPEIVKYHARPMATSFRRAGDHTSLREHLTDSKYQLVTVKVSGRTIHEAADQALDALAQLIGLWSLYVTRGTHSMSMGLFRAMPVGPIQTGPLHTLHHSDGTLVDNICWYDSEFTGDIDLFSPNVGWDQVEKHRRQAVAKMRHLGFRVDLEDLLRRYAACLGRTNFDVAYVNLWSILEKITDTVGTNYNVMTKRASWPHANRKAAEELLHAVRVLRNRQVHGAQTSTSAKEAVYLIKTFVDDHLIRLIYNHFNVNSLAEYAAFLNLPSEPTTLRSRATKLLFAARTRENWQKKDAADEAAASANDETVEG